MTTTIEYQSFPHKLNRSLSRSQEARQRPAVRASYGAAARHAEGFHDAAQPATRGCVSLLYTSFSIAKQYFTVSPAQLVESWRVTPRVEQQKFGGLKDSQCHNGYFQTRVGLGHWQYRPGYLGPLEFRGGLGWDPRIVARDGPIPTAATAVSEGHAAWSFAAS